MWYSSCRRQARGGQPHYHTASPCLLLRCKKISSDWPPVISFHPQQQIFLKAEEEGVEFKKLDTHKVERKDKGGSKWQYVKKTRNRTYNFPKCDSFYLLRDVVDYFNHRLPPLGREGLERLERIKNNVSQHETQAAANVRGRNIMKSARLLCHPRCCGNSFWTVICISPESTLVNRLID